MPDYRKKNIGKVCKYKGLASETTYRGLTHKQVMVFLAR